MDAGQAVDLRSGGPEKLRRIMPDPLIALSEERGRLQPDNESRAPSRAMHTDST